MSTELDKDDLAVLCEGMSRDQVDRVHRLLYEWSAGPMDSFPTQLALLTLAQLHAAAKIPRSLADSRKLLEQHLTEYRRQGKSIADEFSSTASRQAAELKSAGELQIQSLQQAVEQINRKLANAETAAKRVIALMDAVTAVWEDIKTSTTTQCRHLEEVSHDLQDRFAWRVMLRSAAWFLLALGYGILIGHYWHH
jgi:hypothetical protein